MTAKSHSDRLKRMVQRTPKQVAAALYEAGQLIELDWERSITAGSISGKGHIPSKPGEPSNADSRDLDSKIDTKIGGPGLVIVESYSDHAVFQEFGTSNMAARPAARPATERNRKKVTELVGDALRITINR